MPLSVAPRTGDRCETSLYAAVKRHLESLGFAAKGEVCGCDIVAIRAADQPFLVIVEMKLSFSLELVLQAVDRLPMADEIWLAVRASTVSVAPRPFLRRPAEG